MRSEEEIQEQIDQCRTPDGTLTNRWAGMSYEAGVEEALNWVLENSDDLPIESDPSDDS